MIEPSGLDRMQLACTSRTCRRTSLSALVAACAVVLAGCTLPNSGSTTLATGSLVQPGNAPDRSDEKKPAGARVAMLLPLSGSSQTAAVAKAMKQAGELALFDRDNSAFQLVVLDDKGTPEGAKAAAEQAIKDGAELILGPLFAGSVSAAAPIVRQANLSMVAFSNDRQVAGRGVYLMSFLPATEVDRVISFAVSQNKRRIAALIPDDAFGTVAEEAMRSALARHGGSAVAVERYPLQANGMLEPARRLGMTLRELEAAGEPADALFVPGGDQLLAQLGPLVSYAGIDVTRLQVLGTGGMDHPGIGRDPAFAGAWFAAPDPRGWQEFSARFSKTFGSVPPRIASLAYDAVSLAANLAKEPRGTRFTTETLTREAGLQGVDGPVRLERSGLALRGLAVLAVRDFGSVVVDPPPGPAGARMGLLGDRVN